MDENDPNAGTGGSGEERPQPPPHGDLSGTPVGGAGSAGGAGGGAAPHPPTAYSQQIAHSPVSARVPERVARGVMTTGVIVLDSPNEFVLDFLQGLSRPPSIAARVVLRGLRHLHAQRRTRVRT